MSGEAMRVKKEENNINSDVRTNYTGIPTPLKERLEQSSGIALDDVRVHYNSGLPGKLDALAYTRGNQVEIAPGQEHCLPHELGHVVQQKLGIVRANAMHPSGVALNTEAGLERQADEIGAGKRIYATTAPFSGKIVQRKLFIRKSREVVEKKDDEVAKEVKVDKKKPLPDQSKRKKPQWLENDSGYVEITEVSRSTIIEKCTLWLKTIHANAELKLDEVSERITSMIKGKPVKSAKWKYVYEKEVPNQETVPRLAERTVKEVSYYFESLTEFFEYIYLCSIPEENRGDLWVKINVVNTGAGDAVVMTLPKGYLIIDLGTNVNILLNYLGLRKNKVGEPHPEGDDRGISIDGNKTCIIITHDHVDHTAAKSGPKGSNAGLRELAIIGFKQYCEEKKINSEKYSKFMKMLEGSQFEVAEFDPNEKINNLNDDSLVLFRRVNNDEAIVLSGDQGPQRLGAVLGELIGRSQEPVAQMFIKVPHHGSCENNPVSIINLISKLGKKADHVISSQNLYEHPTAGLYVAGFSLMKQGTVLVYSAELPRQDAVVENPDKKMESRFFYTANENSDYKKIALASIAYKSNGREHVTYSKRYTDVSASAQSSDEETLAVEYMLNGIDGLNDSQGNLPKPDKAVSMDIACESIAGRLDASQFFQHKEVFTVIFYNLDAQKQILLLKNIPEPIGLNTFLDSLDINKMNIQPSEEWVEYFAQEWCFISWGQNFFDILLCSCSINPNMLNEKLGLVVSWGNIVLIRRFLKAILKYYPDPMFFIQQVDEEFGVDYFDDEINCALLDLHIKFKNQSVESGSNGNDSAEHILEILQDMPMEKQVELAEYYLTCGHLNSEAFFMVLEQMAEEQEEILSQMGISSYWKMLLLYPEHLETMQEDILDVGNERIDAIINDEEGDDEEKERAVRLGDKINILTTIEAELKEKDYKINSIDEMKIILGNCNIDFVTFIQNISKKALIADIENHKIYFRFAFMCMNENENKSYLDALLETCEAYDISYMSQYLETMTLLLMGLWQKTPIDNVMVKCQILMARLNVNPIEVIMENTWQSGAISDVARVNMVLQKYTQYLRGLLRQEDLPAEISYQCYDILTEIYPELSEELIMGEFGLMRRLLKAPNEQGIPILLDWTENPELKTSYYNRLAIIDPEALSYVFALHLEYYAEEAVCLYAMMEGYTRERLFKKTSLEDLMDLYQRLIRKYSNRQDGIWSDIFTLLKNSVS